MLLFLIPLKSSRVASSWETTCQLLERTLQSICGQTHQSFQILVVCHERPAIAFNHPAISFIQVNFPVPGSTNFQDKYPFRGVARDKHRKLYEGLIQAKTFSPSHVMLMDADDLVSNQLADFVACNPNSDGWYVDRGFEYFEATGKAFPITKRFYGRCGSSHIVRFDILEKIAQSASLETMHRFLHHQGVRNFVLDQGASLDALPFPGAIYITNHGDNMWASKERLGQIFSQRPKALAALYLKRLYKDLVSKRVSADFAQEYGLYDLETAIRPAAILV